MELMAEESSSSSSSNRVMKKESTVVALSSSPLQNDDVEDPVKSAPHSPNNSSTRKACYAVLQSWVSKKFMTGCVVLFPVAVTFFVTWWFIQFVDGFFSPIYERLGVDIFGFKKFEATYLLRVLFVDIFAIETMIGFGRKCAVFGLVLKFRKHITAYLLGALLVDFFSIGTIIDFGLIHVVLCPLSSGLGFITSIIFIFFVGIFASSWLGATVFLIGEWFIKRMPFVKHIYSASKQIGSAVSPDQNTTAFKEVAIIRHPRIGEYAFGFITSSVILQKDEGDEELCSVYVPTNHLYIGDIFLVNSKEIIRPNLSISEGIEIIVSVGMSMPQVISPVERITRQNDRAPLSRMMSY